ncbi:MAG: hypothetical protein ACTS7I_00035 [Candidatus Hodgkinia cicadicola]
MIIAKHRFAPLRAQLIQLLWRTGRLTFAQLNQRRLNAKASFIEA